MKIMYVIKSFAMKAGVERVMSDKMNYLVEHGYEVAMVTYEQGEHSYPFYLNPAVRHYRLDARFFKLGQYPVWQRLWRMHQMRTRFKKGLQEAVDQMQPDIIITTTYSMKVLDLILALRTKACRLIESHIACYTVRKSFDYRNRPLLYQLAQLYDKHVFSRIGKFDKLVVLTQGDAEDWMQYIKDVVIIPNPVTYYPEKILPHDGSERRIISVGRLHEQKGFDMLIDAFALIADQCPEWHIDIFGSGNDHDTLLNQIRQRGMEKRINILPPTNEIYDAYQRSGFYVLSSRYEGFALVLSEAMSCGIPVVAFRCKYGPEDVIVNGENGLLAKNGDISELAESMLWMINHTNERLEMGKKSRKTALMYNKDVIMKRWIELFDSVTKKEK